MNERYSSSFGLLLLLRFVQLKDFLTWKQQLAQTRSLLAFSVRSLIVLLIHFVLLVVRGQWCLLLLSVVPGLTDQRLLRSPQSLQFGRAAMKIRVVGEGAVMPESTTALSIIPTDLTTVYHLGVVQRGRHLDMLLQNRALRPLRLDERIREHWGLQQCGRAIEIWRGQWKFFSGSCCFVYSHVSVLVIMWVAVLIIIVLFFFFILLRLCLVSILKANGEAISDYKEQVTFCMYIGLLNLNECLAWFFFFNVDITTMV